MANRSGSRWVSEGEVSQGTRSRSLAAKCLFSFFLSMSAVAPAFVMGGKADVAIQGKLVVEDGPAAVLQSKDRAIPLTSDRKSIAETLRDSRLSGRELKVLGQFLEDGRFEAHEFFVVRGGSLYKVIYYCEVCNITTFAPGNCVCCQAPTVPVEVLPTDPRIYHDEIKGPPTPPR